MIAWPEGVNKKARRNGTNWDLPNGVIEDKTRSGKKKRRLATSFEKSAFSVSFIFTLKEYRIFKVWWKDVCRFGFYSFAFPCVDDNTGELKEYRFIAGSRPKEINESGDKITVQMEWEEV